MSDWVEFKYVYRGKERSYCLNVYDIRGFSDTGEGTAELIIEAGNEASRLVVAESYEEVRHKIFQATEPSYRVKLTEPKEDK